MSDIKPVYPQSRQNIFFSFLFQKLKRTLEKDWITVLRRDRKKKKKNQTVTQLYRHPCNCTNSSLIVMTHKGDGKKTHLLISAITFFQLILKLYNFPLYNQKHNTSTISCKSMRRHLPSSCSLIRRATNEFSLLIVFMTWNERWGNPISDQSNPVPEVSSDSQMNLISFSSFSSSGWLSMWSKFLWYFLP